MIKRYQVFISSTFSDLKEERKAIIESLLNARYIPSGMEVFSASSDEQFNYIKKIIDYCDYYLIILKSNYGTISKKTGISYTEMEYNYAIEKNIPILAFINTHPEDRSLSIEESQNRKLFWSFREKIMSSRLCKMWDSSLELVPSVINSLNEEVEINPQLGWVRTNIWEEACLIDEINSLRNRKYDLECDLKELRKKSCIKLKDSEKKMVVEGIRVDIIRNQERKGQLVIDLDKIFLNMGESLKNIRNRKEMNKIVTDVVNNVYGSCFTYIDINCINRIIDFLCDKEYINRIINFGEEFIALSNKGYLYLKDS